MISACIDGEWHRFSSPVTILEAVQRCGIELPSLCHDPRLVPTGNCRLCLVEIGDVEHPKASCVTKLEDGMVVRTRTDALEHQRKLMLEILALDHPPREETRGVDKPFIRWLRHYDLEGVRAASPAAAVDESNPYIRVDLSQCILCYRCVRICAEVQGQFVWNVRNRGDETQIVSGEDSALASSDCVSCGACVDSCPTGALVDRQALASPSPTAWTRSTCPYCGTGCEMSVGSVEDRVVGVRPVLDAPVSRGHLCVKGRYAFEFTRANDRVLRPMIRRKGEWQPVSWREALEFTAGELSRIRAERGPDAIGVLGSARATNEENYLAQKFARVVIGTNNIDCCARVCHAPTAAALSAAFGTGAATNSFDDIERAGALLVWGANATENHPIVGARIRQAKFRGAKLLVADPRRTELAAIADVHLQLRPGTDVALLNAMAQVILAEGLGDAEFLATRVDPWDGYAAAMAAWTPERVEPICGVPAVLIRQAARMYATTRPAMSIHGLGVTEHTQGTDGVTCLTNLTLLTGNLGKPGAGVNPLRGQNNVQGSAHMGCEPNHLTGYATLEQGRSLFESTWGQRLPTSPGRHLLAMMDAAREGQLSALWAIGYDLLLTNADAAATRAALGQLELVVVQDMFLTETAREFGTVFLPVASSFEKDGTFMNSERRVQRVRKAVDPPGEARPDWQIICSVAQAMGVAEGFDFDHPEKIWNEIRSVWKAGAGISYARLEQGGLQWPCPTEDHPGTPILHTTEFPHGPRAALQAVSWQPPPAQCSAEFPLMLSTGRSLYHFNAGTMTMRTANRELRPTDLLSLAPADASALGVHSGEMVRVVSRYGEAQMPAQVKEDIQPGTAFATFQDASVFLNQITTPFRDAVTATPAYKVNAIRVEKLSTAFEE